MGDQTLLLQAEKTLACPLRGDLVSCCPTMDLIAVVTQDEQLEVYRFNGQKAFGLRRRNPDTTVQSICWKFNGQYIAVGWQDGTVDVVSAESGKVLQHFKHVTTAEENPTEPEPALCIGWSLNMIKAKPVSDRINQSAISLLAGKPGQEAPEIDNLRDHISLDDFLDRQPDHETLSILPNLPEELALLDVENVLPKLPIVPLLTATGSSSINPEIFASQPALDILLQQHTRDHNSVETLIVHNANRTGRIILYDSLNVGTFRYPERWASLDITPLLHVSHPFSYTHMILVKTKAILPPKSSYTTRTPRMSTRRTQVAPEDSPGFATGEEATRLALVPFALRFIKSSGIILHIIASKTSQLQNILQYILRCVESVSYLWNTSHDLPSRFMANIEEDLAEGERGTLVQNLYHLAMTGDCPEPLKEWIVDQIAERGHKRWDHSVSNGYQRILDLTHENLLPALDRCTMLVSALRGLALHYQESQILDVPLPMFRVAMERIQCLRFLAHQVLIIASEERRQFIMFSRWFRHQIEIQSTEPTSAAADEVYDRDIGVDYAQLLAYIRGALKASKMPKFMEDAELSTIDDLDVLSYENLQKQLKVHNSGTETTFPCLSLWVHFKGLKSNCLDLVKRITFSQAAGTDVACGIFLEDGDVSSLDTKMVRSGTEDVSNMFTYVVYVPESKPDEVRLHRLYHDSYVDDARSIKSAKTFAIAFEGFKCLDAKFADEKHLLILLANHSSSYILSFDLCPMDSNHEFERNFQDWTVSDHPTKSSLIDFELPNGQPSAVGPAIRLSLAQIERFVKHKFDAGEHFRPLMMEVNGRKDRRVICVVGEGLRQYRILDLDFQAGQLEQATVGVRDSGSDELIGDD